MATLLRLLSATHERTETYTPDAESMLRARVESAKHTGKIILNFNQGKLLMIQWQQKHKDLTEAP